VGVAQGGNAYFTNTHKDVEGIHAAFSANFKQTAVRFSVTQNKLLVNQGYGITTPDGELWTGAGRENQNITKDSGLSFSHIRLSGTVENKISENWSQKISLANWNLYRNSDHFGRSFTFPTGYDWAAKTITFNAQSQDYHYTYWSFLYDVQGNYNLGGLNQTDSFGGGWSEYTTRGRVWLSPTYKPTVSMYDAAAISALVAPLRSEFDPASFPNKGFQNQIPVYSIYWQHETELIPDKLSLVAGVSWSGITTNSVANVGIKPWAAVKTPVSDYLHRYGITYKPIKGIALYAMQGTSFNPPNQGATLYSGAIPPAQQGEGNEVGVKTLLFNNKLSLNIGFFRMLTTNVLVVGGQNPSGLTYWDPVGTLTQKGIDGNIMYSPVQNLEFIGSFYLGTVRNQLGKPVSTAYDNSWSLLTRYICGRDGKFRGLSFGSGITRVGGRWQSIGQVTNGNFTATQLYNGVLKLKTGTALNAFLSYDINRNLSASVRCNNILDQAYPFGMQSAVTTDPSLPRQFVFEMTYNFKGKGNH
jgi:iron complex outermembrane recepter protein